MQRSLRMGLLAAAILGLVPQFATADQITIGAARDGIIFSESNNSDGASYDLFVGRNNINGGTSRRSLIQFDLSALPENVVINSVTLKMQMSGGSPSGVGPGTENPQGYTGPINVALYRLLGDWGEGKGGTSFNGGTSAGMAGGAYVGVAPTLGDATWGFQSWNSDPWTTPGGDFFGTASATKGVSTTPQEVKWSSQGLINDVQAWADNPTTNFGWIILGDERTNGTSRRFVSSEAPNASFHPELTVDFSPVPEPSSMTLAGIAGLALGWFGRRNLRKLQP